MQDPRLRGRLVGQLTGEPTGRDGLHANPTRSLDMKKIIIATLATAAATPAFAHTSSFLHSHAGETFGMMAIAALVVGGVAVWAKK